MLRQRGACANQIKIEIMACCDADPALQIVDSDQDERIDRIIAADEPALP